MRQSRISGVVVAFAVLFAFSPAVHAASPQQLDPASAWAMLYERACRLSTSCTAIVQAASAPDVDYERACNLSTSCMAIIETAFALAVAPASELSTPAARSASRPSFGAPRLPARASSDSARAAAAAFVYGIGKDFNSDLPLSQGIAGEIAHYPTQLVSVFGSFGVAFSGFTEYSRDLGANINASITAVGFNAGVRIYPRRSLPGARPFVQGSFGYANASVGAKAFGLTFDDLLDMSAFSVGPAVGVDVPLSDRVELRIAGGVGITFREFQNPTGFAISTGLVFGFGG